MTMDQESKYRLASGHVVVFEGLDKAGKSTQIDALHATFDPDTVTFAHMPSGFTEFTKRVYEALESKEDRPKSGLAQQLAHLSCHAENMSELVKAAKARTLILDRWWWSTLAYGWYGGDVPESGLSESAFRALIDAVWAPITASVIFVFLTPHERDDNNVTGVEGGYRTLYEEFADRTVLIPVLSEPETKQFILDELLRRDIAVLA
jgi:dTMP kinase